MRIETIITITLIAMMLVLTGCARSNALTGNGSAETEDIGSDTLGDTAADTTETPDETTTEEPAPEAKVEEPKPEVFTNVTEAPVYSDVANTCKEDDKGVVRVFDAAGNKKVYRNLCSAGLLTEVSCINGSVVSTNSRCPKGCKTTPYGAVCLDAPLPVHTPVTGPPPTSD